MSKPTDQELAAFLEELLAHAPGQAEDARTPAEIEDGMQACFGKAKALLERIRPSARAVDPDMPIAGLGLTVRNTNLLARLGITTLGHLLKHNPSDLRKLPGVGRNAAEAIELAVAPYGGLATESIDAAGQRRRHAAIEREIAQNKIRVRAAGADAALKKAIADLEASVVRESKQVRSLLDSMRRVGELLATQVGALDEDAPSEEAAGAFELTKRIERSCQFVDFVVLEVRNTLAEAGQAA